MNGEKGDIRWFYQEPCIVLFARPDLVSVLGHNLLKNSVTTVTSTTTFLQTL